MQPIRHAIVAVIVAPDERLLLIERSAQDTFPNYWNPVTGSMDPDDHDIIAACKREVMEEVGIEIEVIGKLWESTTRSAPFLLHWFLARPPQPIEQLSFTLEDGEVDDIRWATLDEVRSLPLTFDDSRIFFRHVYESARASLPAIA